MTMGPSFPYAPARDAIANQPFYWVKMTSPLLRRQYMQEAPWEAGYAALKAEKLKSPNTERLSEGTTIRFSYPSAYKRLGG
mmetsp:Transcript_19337/g.77312  ORF Transcript_19337/g.77312 Transcript_19337/m.77312 type:complete len:81 (-) Transcript_19337:401-643(-)